ncbi:diaminopimelate epimerase [Zooshikella marina]|uniref:diaminopimelate epimerase n=1 Tax=Zooshikella ganghwensis TaxID=202772 RepID=UPI001BAFD1A9|nr:diaminopimelate epimerase [Zooshikella ganghwensis]MBU2708218.1 diaminopimelate epimerase [Zooshikella ganghwensis]
MLLRFTKMHGLGNDFMVIDLVTQHARLTEEKIKQLANRHFGIGFDQLLIVEPPSKPDVDFKYRIFNADGSEVEQCGNGARCFARFVRDRKLTSKRTINVETQGGDITLIVHNHNDVEVDMGYPILEPALIPFHAEQQAITYPINCHNQAFEISAVSMGNPHMVLVVEDILQAQVEKWGPLLEKHESFPQRANVGFMQVINSQQIKLRVFERGAGETLACGTGACAAVVAGRLQNLLAEQVQVDLPGGSLQIEWQGSGHSVRMIGPATRVFEGQVRI